MTGPWGAGFSRHTLRHACRSRGFAAAAWSRRDVDSKDHKRGALTPGLGRALRAGLLTLLLLFAPVCAAGVEIADADPQARSLFPQADRVGASEGSPPAAPVYRQGKVIGYLFLTQDIVSIPAYSGRPINVLVGVGTDGRIAGARVVHHEEPILAAGVSEERLARYVDQYRGQSAAGRIIVGGHRPGYATIDGMAGATITTMVINATISRAARLVAESRGIQAAPPDIAHEPPAPLAPTAAPQAAPKAPSATAPASPAREAEPAPPRSAHAVRTTKRPAATVPPQSAPPAPARAAAAPPLASSARVAKLEDEEPMWTTVWKRRRFDIAVLAGGLVLLTGVFLFQDYLARRSRLLERVRTGFLLYTLFFVGWYGLGQLSIINVLTFVQALTQHFTWDTFLIDPMLFILWSFVAVTLLLWGRGVYCGWLCPFGALQELTFQLARKLKLPYFKIPDVVHERLLAFKFVIMLGLFGLSLQSMGVAIRAAEIEPFKTAINFHFQREWGYVAFAAGLILLGVFNRKFYCKYVCPLGASLIIPGRFHSFEWLRRRKECGRPCQVCAAECEVQAIRPTGEIVVNECHQCLDCQVTYYNDRKCPPLIEKRKRRDRGSKARASLHGAENIEAESSLASIPVRVETATDRHANGPSDTSI